MLRCAWEGCEASASGKSKYCATHRAEARDQWVKMIANKHAERANRDAEFAELWERAERAGIAAAERAVPRPMVVCQPADALASIRGEPTASRVIGVVSDGPCGFAWVRGPGVGSFGAWVKRAHKARPDYPSGLCYYYVHQYGQSYVRKAAFASAFADALRAAGITGVYARERLD